MTLRATNRTGSVVLPTTGRVVGGVVRGVGVGGTSAANPSAPQGSAFGLLDKTNGSFLLSSLSDLAGMPDYSTDDWSAEIAFRFDERDFMGDYGEIFRNGVSQCAFSSAKAGWFIGTDATGYTGGVRLMAALSDGAGVIQSSYVSMPYGLIHAVITYDLSADTFRFYVNGVEEYETIAAGFVLPATFGNLAIGINNKGGDSYTPGAGGIAMPNFKAYFARIWSSELQAAAITAIYDGWIANGSIATPGGATLVSDYQFRTEVSDAAGTPGTGWIADTTGANHLKIVDHDSGTTSTLCSITVPSGTIACSSPADSATGVSGAVILQAAGTVGTANAVLYSFEIDEVNTFDGAELKQSGWQVSDPFWKPLLEPSTLYYWRCKVKDSDDTASAWSTTRSFTTRAATLWYVRPKAAAATYGTEDGTSYANAWNDLRWNGQQNGVNLSEFVLQADFEKTAPGDTLYVCGDWGLMSSASMSLASTKPQVRYLNALGFSAAVPVYVKLDDATNPGTAYRFFRYTGSITWTDTGGGIFSTTTKPTSFSAIAVDDGGGLPEMASATSHVDSLLQADATETLASAGYYVSGGTLFVRMSDDLTPGTQLHYLVTNSTTFSVHTSSSQHLNITGGKWYGQGISIGGTNVTVTDAAFKYDFSSAAFDFGNDKNNWTLDGVEISFALNAVYGHNTTSSIDGSNRTANFITIKGCHFHDLGTGAWADNDAHAVGVQAGTDWTIQDNYFHDCGTAVEFWASTKPQTGNIVQRNVIQDVTARTITQGHGIAFSGGSATLGLRTGCQVKDNTVIDVDGSGIHLTMGDDVTVTGNLVQNTGLGVDTSAQEGISFRNVDTGVPCLGTVTDNIVINPKKNFINFGGDGDLTGMTLEDNLYWDDVDTASTTVKFKANGSYSSYTSFNDWVANTPFDQASQFADPIGATLASGFEDLKRSLFLRANPGDVDNDAVVDADDMTALLAAASITPGGSQNPAYVTWLEEITP